MTQIRPSGESHAYELPMSQCSSQKKSRFEAGMKRSLSDSPSHPYRTLRKTPQSHPLTLTQQQPGRGFIKQPNAAGSMWGLHQGLAYYLCFFLTTHSWESRGNRTGILPLFLDFSSRPATCGIPTQELLFDSLITQPNAAERCMGIAPFVGPASRILLTP